MDISAVFDPVYILVLVLSVIFMVGLHTLIYRVSATNSPAAAPRAAEENPNVNRRQRVEVEEDEESGEEDDEEPQNANQGGAKAPKIYGKKKRAKMEREAARKEYNKQTLERNKERVAEQKKELKEMRKQEKEAEKVQATEDEAWEKYLEDKRKKEEEEYQSWKPSISLEESGSGATERDVLEARAEEVITVVKQERSIILESLSARFHTSTAKMVELLTVLVKERRLEGVFDEHGKFIYVSKEDRLKIAKIIQRRGRVGIGELASEVNAVISIDPIEIPTPADSSSAAPE